MKRSVLITGIDGFTGRYLASRLITKGYAVHGIVRAKDDLAGIEGVDAIYQCDLLDTEGIQAIFAQVRPQKVVHLAAVAFVAHGDLNEMYRTNILGTRSILEACSQPKFMPTSLLLASSANVYGNATAGVLDESATVSPANDYGVSKAATEQLARIYGDRVPIILTRPFNYTGVGQSDAFVIPKIISHLKCRAPIIELGNLDVARDISDVRAIVDAYERLLEAPEAIGQTFNVCSGKASTLRDILDMAMYIADHTMDVRVNPAFVRANEVRMLCGSKAKIESIIGPITHPPLNETLRWMIEA